MTASRDGILPWTRSCFVCGEDNPHGLRLRSRREGEWVILEYTPQPRDLGWRHLVHGGIAMTLLDEVMTWSAMLHARRACVAAEISVRLREPIRVGDPLTVRARVSAARARLTLTEGVIAAAGGTVATGTGKYLPMPAGGVPLCAEDFRHDDASLAPRDVIDLP
jgi:acyl-coenzyme A thioesterase PaaI-like protein